MELLKRYSKLGGSLERIEGQRRRAAPRPAQTQRHDVANPARKQVHRRLNESERHEVVIRYLAGVETGKLAVAFKVHRDTIRSVLDKAGVRRPVRRLSPSQVANACDRRAAGESYGSIARSFGVGTETVRRNVMAQDARQVWATRN